MTIGLAIILSTICFALGTLHIYWAFNGQWGRNEVVPTQENGEKLFEIGPFSCLVVAIILIALSYFYFQFRGSILPKDNPILSSIYNYGPLLVAAGFLIRAIGDFKYVGFFKSFRNTRFGRLDSKYFSPLCLLLGLGSLALYFLSH